MNNERFIEEIECVLRSHDSAKLVPINNAYVAEFGGTGIYKNEESFFETFFQNNYFGLARAVTNGSYDPTDEWVTLDIHGDILSSHNAISLTREIGDLAEFASKNFKDFSHLFPFDEDSFDDEE